jgi:hypothetical protein
MKFKFSNKNIPLTTDAAQQTDASWLDDKLTTYDEIL